MNPIPQPIFKQLQDLRMTSLQPLRHNICQAIDE
jgi:hypothetical protein